MSPALAGGFLTASATWEAQVLVGVGDNWRHSGWQPDLLIEQTMKLGADGSPEC